jgi:protein TonB
MKYFVALVFISVSFFAFSQVKPNAADSILYVKVDQPPVFPGGLAEQTKFIKTNLKLPSGVKTGKINGKCFLKIVIWRDGSPGEAKMIKGMPECPDCETEAFRLVSKLPKFQPGVFNDAPVHCYYNLVIEFKK